MTVALWAIIAGLAITFSLWLARKIRRLLALPIKREAWRIQLRLGRFPRHDLVLAVERLAQEITQRVCKTEGNPDQEYILEQLRWFMGNPEAVRDYRRKQFRDLNKEPLWKSPPASLDYDIDWKEAKLSTPDERAIET